MLPRYASLILLVKLAMILIMKFEIRTENTLLHGAFREGW